eukprot:SAG11_NODE_167_length_13647_cov_7.705049_3_plen_63_part_00
MREGERKGAVNSWRAHPARTPPSDCRNRAGAVYKAFIIGRQRGKKYVSPAQVKAAETDISEQ